MCSVTLVQDAFVLSGIRKIISHGLCFSLVGMLLLHVPNELQVPHSTYFIILELPSFFLTRNKRLIEWKKADSLVSLSTSWKSKWFWKQPCPFSSMIGQHTPGGEAQKSEECIRPAHLPCTCCFSQRRQDWVSSGEPGAEWSGSCSWIQCLQDFLQSEQGHSNPTSSPYHLFSLKSWQVTRHLGICPDSEDPQFGSYDALVGGRKDCIWIDLANPLSWGDSEGKDLDVVLDKVYQLDLLVYYSFP